jgi:hypothetical protein
MATNATLEVGSPVYLSLSADRFEAYGCETATGYAGTHTYCHQEVAYTDGEGSGYCLSMYGVQQNGQITLQDCDALGGGQQTDQLFYFDSITGSFPGPGYLISINSGGSCEDYGCALYSNGDASGTSYVRLGEWLGAPNEEWYLNETTS